MGEAVNETAVAAHLVATLAWAAKRGVDRVSWDESGVLRVKTLSSPISFELQQGMAAASWGETSRAASFGLKRIPSPSPSSPGKKGKFAVRSCPLDDAGKKRLAAALRSRRKQPPRLLRQARKVTGAEVEEEQEEEAEVEEEQEEEEEEEQEEDEKGVEAEGGTKAADFKFATLCRVIEVDAPALENCAKNLRDALGIVAAGEVAASPALDLMIEPAAAATGDELQRLTADMGPSLSANAVVVEAAKTGITQSEILDKLSSSRTTLANVQNMHAVGFYMTYMTIARAIIDQW
ncbi:MAG: hypothetical protein BJ554DRAFT_5022, partial [Olpidium bornovanus]